MQPLCIEWRFCSPLVLPSDHPVHLDALLAYACVARAERAGSEDPLSAQEDLPLAQEGGVWKASQLVFEPYTTPGLFNMVRRFDPDALAAAKGVIFDTRKNKFESGTGKFRAFAMRYPYQWMERAQAWCFGDPEKIEDLLGELTHIGKLARNGFGKVTKRTVSVVSEPQAELWRLRAIPCDRQMELSGASYAPRPYRLRPPYWMREGLEMARLPLDPAEAVRAIQ